MHHSLLIAIHDLDDGDGSAELLRASGSGGSVAQQLAMEIGAPRQHPQQDDAVGADQRRGPEFLRVQRTRP